MDGYFKVYTNISNASYFLNGDSGYGYTKENGHFDICIYVPSNKIKFGNRVNNSTGTYMLKWKAIEKDNGWTF